MRQVVYIYLILLFILPEAFSQDKASFKKTFLEAEYFFMTEEYQEAVFYYNELLKIDPENANFHFLIGACYLSIPGEKKKAIPHLERAVEDMSVGYREGSYKERSAPRESLFALARAYHINEEFDRAIAEYEKYRGIMIKRHFADIEYVNKQIKSCELAKSMILRPVDIQYLRLSEEVNRFPVNYNPVISYDDSTLIYMTDRPLYKAIMMCRKTEGGVWTEPRVINEDIGSDGDCYPASLSADGKELYLVNKDPYESDIYISYRKAEMWTKMISLNNQINSIYYETHACVSFNGKFLFFTSDRPGGQGGLDIWVSETTAAGDWGEPRNLGPKINSHYNEETPFLSGDGKKLYFSSQGHATMGGFDFFVADKLPTMRITTEENDRTRGKPSSPPFDAGWSFPENLGYPISTADDDLFYNPSKTGQGAYCSTIVDSISPVRSIYVLRVKGDLAQITAIRQDDVQRIDPEVLRTSSRTDRGISIIDEEPARDSLPETVPGSETGPVSKPKPSKGTTDPDEYFVLNSILFGFDSSELDDEAKSEMERVFDVMRQHPEIKLELTGHTDAVGSEEYNRRLSDQRAQSIALYLIGKGIQASRIKVTSAGETAPIARNMYEDGSDSPDGRRLNRQVSIKLENLQDERIRVMDVFVPEHLQPRAEKAFSVLLLNSNVMLDTMPDEVAGEKVALIVTDSAFLYTAGNFKQKVRAMQYLNVVIDEGFPDANMLEQKDLERLIASLSEGGIQVSSSYTIQIMALKKPVRIDYFKPLEGVVMYAGRDGFHRYVYGEFESLGKALEKLPSIKQMGYSDAFIKSILRYEKLSE